MNDFVNISRYRWTPEEKEQILDQLLTDLIPTTHEPEVIQLSETFDKAQELLVQGDGIIGLSTGYPSIDQMTRGLAPGDLAIIYGDTSHGKSQLSQNISYNLAARGDPVFFAGLEMTNEQNTSRFIQMAREREEARGLPILYPKNNYFSYKEIGALISTATKMGAKLIVLDQLQDITHSLDNSTNEISLVTLEVKRAAVQNQVPVILISHINRSGNKSGPPTLAELKGSSAIEQRADIAIAVWRDFDAEDGLLHVRLRKNRNRGMAFHSTTLQIKDGVKLVEPVDMSNVQAIFPGATEEPTKLKWG